MTSGYTKDQLAQLWRELDETVLPLPTEAEKADAPRVSAMRVSGTDLGLVVNLAFKKAEAHMVQFNAVIAKELAGAINEAGLHFGWQKRGMVPAPSDHIQPPVPGDMPSALVISTFSTYAIAAGILVKVLLPQMGESGTTIIWYFPRERALELLTYIYDWGEATKIWTPEFEIIPSDSEH